MLAKPVKPVFLGICLVCSMLIGGPHLLAADDPPDLPELLPLPEPESTLDQPPEADLLDLPKSSEIIEGECGKCDDCEEYKGCEEGCYAPCRRFWLRADYLAWWTKRSRVPPLVTTSPNGAPPGVLGSETTEVLFGGSRVHGDGRSSFRVTMGYWIDCCQTWGLEGDYFDLEGKSIDYYSGFSSGDPVLARPFFDVVNQVQSSQVIASPGVAVGDIGVRTSEYFHSTGAWLRRNLFCLEEWCETPQCDGCPSCETEYCQHACCYEACDPRRIRVDLIGGYRYYQLADDLAIREHIVSTNSGGQVAIGTTFDIDESFQARNEFNGGELGLTAEVYRGRWSLELLAKMALGNNHQVVMIGGTTGSTVPGQATVGYTGGLLALPTNIGRYTRNDFVIIPQFGMEFGYQLSDCVRVTLGYDFLYWAQVARAGDQINLNIDPRNIPPVSSGAGPEPIFEFRGADFWAQGISLGLERSF